MRQLFDVCSSSKLHTERFIGFVGRLSFVQYAGRVVRRAGPAPPVRRTGVSSRGVRTEMAAGPSAMLHRSTGLSRKQIRARRRFTTVLRQSRLRTTVGLISAIAGQPALILIKSVCRFPAIFIQMPYPEMRHGKIGTPLNDSGWRRLLRRD
jgi:hypothetical protein